jgi:DNA-binding MarR family transcriptional regulator
MMDVASDTTSENSGLRKPSVIAWLRLAKIYHKVDRASAEHLSTYGLSVGQFDVLAQVGAHEGITQKELAEKLLVTKSNICQILGRMEERGLVSRRQEGRAKIGRAHV